MSEPFYRIEDGRRGYRAAAMIGGAAAVGWGTYRSWDHLKYYKGLGGAMRGRGASWGTVGNRIAREAFSDVRAYGRGVGATASRAYGGGAGMWSSLGAGLRAGARRAFFRM